MVHRGQRGGKKERTLEKNVGMLIRILYTSEEYSTAEKTLISRYYCLKKQFQGFFPPIQVSLQITNDLFFKMKNDGPWGKKGL